MRKTLGIAALLVLAACQAGGPSTPSNSAPSPMMATPPPPTPVASAPATTAPAPSVTAPTGATAPPTLQATQALSEVTIESFSFMPQMVSVRVGTTVRWTSLDPSRHTVTSGLVDEPDGRFASGVLEQGDQFELVADEVGIFAFYCELHPRMTAELEVVQ